MARDLRSTLPPRTHSLAHAADRGAAVLPGKPRAPEELLAYANERYQMGWSTRAQVDRRRGLLGGLGAIEATDDGRLVLTELGRTARESLVVTGPATVEAESEKPAELDTGPVVEAQVQPSPDLDQLVERLEQTAHDSGDPDAFEKATRDAFAFLGFESEWLGGAGKTDVLLVAELGGGDRFRVIVDTKSTSHEAVGDAQVDWETLDEHKEQYDADYVALVAPAFKGGRLQQRATAKGRAVVLIDTPALVELVRQHERIPLDLRSYRRLFEAEGGPEEIGELAGQDRRLFDLAAEVLRKVDEFGQHEGSLTARDLYWNLDLEDEFERATREEIEQVARTLTAPPFRLLREDDAGHSSAGSLEMVARRLEWLATPIRGS